MHDRSRFKLSPPTRAILFDYLKPRKTSNTSLGKLASQSAVRYSTLYSLMIVDRVFQVAKANPALAAVISRGNAGLVCHTFDSLASRIADYSQLFGNFEPGSRVAFILPQGFEAYAAILAAIHSGVVFCPLDPKLPSDRLFYCLEQLRPCLLLVSDTAQVSHFPGVESVAAADAPKHASLAEKRHCDSAYIIFTSGSTGLPKGVEILRCGVQAFLDWAWSRYRISVGERWAQFSSLGFDLSLVDMLCCLPQGGTLVPFSADIDRAFPSRLIRSAGINVWHSVPSVIPLLTEYGTGKPELLTTLRLATFCGEPLYPQQVDKLLALNPGLAVFNTYGPTEATFFCSCTPVTSTLLRRHAVRSLPIGEAVPGWTFHFEPIPNTNLEELWIASRYIGKGYISPTPDQERFSTLQTEHGLTRAYRTGDLFDRVTPTEAVFARRTDKQVKVRGNRIDLSEVEYQALAFGAKEAKALLSDDGLVLFVALRNTTEQALREYLAKTLPSPAIPNFVFSLEALPHNINGKVDQADLLKLLNHHNDETRPDVTPQH